MGVIKEIGVELIGLDKYFIADEDQYLEAFRSKSCMQSMTPIIHNRGSVKQSN
ncbi:MULTISPECIES: hypothetical protein [unclassified Psychrobacter]|jgi:hypothetical protein|uniref:hypothetical protein n=1 Tax=unclassified Psychrobacter TaxID=196806 RepID=UPI0014197012|nr:hypothetical protein [Psychrobacter sp. 230]|tara:strand:+ start:1396 stop:1554 length:159 start_codon:yes stop_codon:yes gene_type:complete